MQTHAGIARVAARHGCRGSDRLRGANYGVWTWRPALASGRANSDHHPVGAVLAPLSLRRRDASEDVNDQARARARRGHALVLFAVCESLPHRIENTGPKTKARP